MDPNWVSKKIASQLWLIYDCIRKQRGECQKASEGRRYSIFLAARNVWIGFSAINLTWKRATYTTYEYVMVIGAWTQVELVRLDLTTINREAHHRPKIAKKYLSCFLLVYGKSMR